MCDVRTIISKIRSKSKTYVNNQNAQTYETLFIYLFIYFFNEAQFLTVYETISNLFYIISIFSKFSYFCNNSTAYFPC